MISRLVLALALVSSLFVSVTSQTCAGAGYDFSSIGFTDLSLVSGGYTWRIRPCGVVNGTGAGACAGNVCQSSTLVSTYDQQAATWYTIPGGVVQALANGATCGGPRRSNIIFACNSSATTPFISSITEPIQCQYNSTIQTSLACAPSSTTSGNYVGASRTSTTCGGGLFDLTALNSSDIRGSYAGTNYSIRVCGLSDDSRCSGVQPSSICQMAGGGTYNLATYAPTTANPVLYTVTSNGLNLIQQTGATCSIGGANVPRWTNISLACNQTATTPYLTSVIETSTCRYNIMVQTNQVCSFIGSSASSSSGGIVVLPGSSSTGVSNGTVARSSSSSSAPVANVTVSSSSASVVVNTTGSSSSAATVNSTGSSTGSVIPLVSSSSAAAGGPSSSSSAAARSSSSSAAQSSSAAFVSSSASQSSSAVPLSVSSSAPASSSVAAAPASSSSTAPAAGLASSSSTNSPAVASSSSAAGGVVSSSSDAVVPPVESSTGSVPPQQVNGAGSFSPSVIALIVAVIVAVVGQF